MRRPRGLRRPTISVSREITITPLSLGKAARRPPTVYSAPFERRHLAVSPRRTFPSWSTSTIETGSPMTNASHGTTRWVSRACRKAQKISSSSAASTQISSMSASSGPGVPRRRCRFIAVAFVFLRPSAVSARRGRIASRMLGSTVTGHASRKSASVRSVIEFRENR